MEAAQGSSLHGMDNHHTHSNATLLMDLHHIVENSLSRYTQLSQQPPSGSKLRRSLIIPCNGLLLFKAHRQAG